MKGTKIFDVSNFDDFPPLSSKPIKISKTNKFPDIPFLNDLPSKQEWQNEVSKIMLNNKRFTPIDYDEFIKNAVNLQDLLIKSKTVYLSYDDICSMININNYLVNNINKIYFSDKKIIAKNTPIYGIINANIPDDKIYELFNSYGYNNNNKNIIQYLSCFEQRHADHLVYDLYENYFLLNDKYKSYELTNDILDELIKDNKTDEESRIIESEYNKSMHFLIKELKQKYCRLFDDWNNVTSNLISIIEEITNNIMFIIKYDRENLIIDYQNTHQYLYQSYTNELVSNIIDKYIDNLIIPYPKLDKTKQQLKYELYKVITDYALICDDYKHINTKSDFDVSYGKDKLKYYHSYNSLQEKLYIYNKKIRTYSIIIDNIINKKIEEINKKEKEEENKIVNVNDYAVEETVEIEEESESEPEVEKESESKSEIEEEIEENKEKIIKNEIKSYIVNILETKYKIQMSPELDFEQEFEIIYYPPEEIFFSKFKYQPSMLMCIHDRISYDNFRIHNYEQFIKLLKVYPEAYKMFSIDWTGYKPDIGINSYDDITEEMWGIICEGDGRILKTLPHKLQEIIKQKYNIYTTTRCWSCYLRKPCYKYRGSCQMSGYENMFECESCGEYFEGLKNNGEIQGCLHCYYQVERSI